MNKIEKMIKEMCPNGVEYKKIEDVTIYEQPTEYIVKNTNYSDEYERILYKQYRTPYGAEGLSTNTIMTVLGVWGIFIGAYYLLGLLLFSKTICHRDRSKSFLVFIAILMMISNEAIVYSLLLQIMIMYGYASSPIAYSQT